MSLAPDTTPSQEVSLGTEISPSNNKSVYTHFLHALDRYRYSCDGPNALTKADAVRFLYLSLKDFVGQRTALIPEMPWLEPRLNPRRLRVAPSYSMTLPPSFDVARTVWEQESDTAFVPYAPPVEYFTEPPENRYQPKTALDAQALEILRRHGLSALANLAATDTAYYTALQALDEAERLSIYATWARDTTHDATELMRSVGHQDGVTRMFHTGEIIPLDNPLTDYAAEISHPITIPMPQDLLLAAKQASGLLEGLQDDIREHVDNSYSKIPDYDKRADTLFDGLTNIIDGCRWHLEHGTTDDAEVNGKLCDTIIFAYSNLNFLIQTCNTPGKSGKRFQKHHDIATLLAGVKVDNPDGSAHGGDRFLSYRTSDYFEAFMAASQYTSVALAATRLMISRERVNWKKHNGIWPLFGDFDTAYETIEQQLVTMAVMYLRMPEWQRTTYANILQTQFGLVEDLLSNNQSSQLAPLYIPSRQIPQPLHPDYYLSRMNQPADYYTLAAIEPMNVWTDLRDSLLYNHHDAKIHAQSTWIVTGRVTHASTIRGFGSVDAYIDEYGFIHPGREPRQETVVQLQHVENPIPEPTQDLPETEQPTTWIEQLDALPSLTAAARLGEEGGWAIEQLLERNPESGSVQSLSHTAAMAERLLGRDTPPDEENDLIHVLNELSMLHETQLDLDTADTDSVTKLIKKMRTGEANTSHLDEGGLLLLMLATTGSIPRDYLVELIFKNYEVLQSSLALELVDTLERLNNKRLSVQLHLKSVSHPISDARRALQDYFAHKTQDAAYDPKTDPDLFTFALPFIEKVTALLRANKTYDATMKSPLVAVLTAKEQGVLVARCNVDGETLLALLKFISPQLASCFASTYGPEELLALEDWYRYLLESEGSGHASHGYTLTYFPAPDSKQTIVNADATSGKTDVLAPPQILPLESKTQHMQYGEAAILTSSHYWGDQRESHAMCLRGGSHTMATLAMEAHELDYALLANPDDVELHRQVVVNSTKSAEERTASLDYILRVRPRWLAASPQNDHMRGATTEGLRRIIAFARQTGRFEGAIFATNILRYAGYLSPAVNAEGAHLHELVMREIATLDETKITQVSAGDPTLITSHDVVALRAAREQYLAELEKRKLAAPNEDSQTLEARLREESLTAITAEHKHVDVRLSEETRRLYQADLVAEREREAITPTIGTTATREIAKQIDSRADEIYGSAKTNAELPHLLPFAFFESVNIKTQESALLSYLSNSQGQIVDASIRERRLQILQQVIARVSLDYVKRHPLQLQKTGDIGLLAPTDLEEQVLSTIKVLQGGLEATAGRLGIPLSLPPVKEMVFVHNKLLAPLRD